MNELRHDLATWRFWRRFLVHAFAATGAIAIVLEIINELFPKQLTFRGSPWGLIIIAASAIFGLMRSWPRPIEQAYSSPNTTIKIIKGDIFDQPEHLVIGTCDTFDTEPPHIIARESIQAQALDRLFGGDLADLNGRLDAALSELNQIDTIHKPGKQKRYELGSVAVLTQAARKVFFLAYTSMDGHNRARATVDGVWKSLLKLWSAVSQHSNGGTVSIPVIGGGQARIAHVLPAQDSIRFIALSFMLASRQEKICDELRIVVRPIDYRRLDRLELQAFLSSLRPS